MQPRRDFREAVGSPVHRFAFVRDAGEQRHPTAGDRGIAEDSARAARWIIHGSS